MSNKTTAYQIRVKGHITNGLREWFAPLTILNEPTGEALLTGPIRDQSELFGVLLKLFNLNFTLLAVQPAPDLQTDKETPHVQKP